MRTPFLVLPLLALLWSSVATAQDGDPVQPPPPRVWIAHEGGTADVFSLIVGKAQAGPPTHVDEVAFRMAMCGENGLPGTLPGKRVDCDESFYWAGKKDTYHDSLTSRHGPALLTTSTGELWFVEPPVQHIAVSDLASLTNSLAGTAQGAAGHAGSWAVNLDVFESAYRHGVIPDEDNDQELQIGRLGPYKVYSRPVLVDGAQLSTRVGYTSARKWSAEQKQNAGAGVAADGLHEVTVTRYVRYLRKAFEEDLQSTAETKRFTLELFPDSKKNEGKSEEEFDYFLSLKGATLRQVGLADLQPPTDGQWSPSSRLLRKLPKPPNPVAITVPMPSEGSDNFEDLCENSAYEQHCAADLEFRAGLAIATSLADTIAVKKDISGEIFLGDLKRRGYGGPVDPTQTALAGPWSGLDSKGYYKTGFHGPLVVQVAKPRVESHVIVDDGIPSVQWRMFNDGLQPDSKHSLTLPGGAAATVSIERQSFGQKVAEFFSDHWMLIVIVLALAGLVAVLFTIAIPGVTVTLFLKERVRRLLARQKRDPQGEGSTEDEPLVVHVDPPISEPDPGVEVKIADAIAILRADLNHQIDRKVAESLERVSPDGLVTTVMDKLEPTILGIVAAEIRRAKLEGPKANATPEQRLMKLAVQLRTDLERELRTALQSHTETLRLDMDTHKDTLEGQLTSKYQRGKEALDYAQQEKLDELTHAAEQQNGQLETVRVAAEQRVNQSVQGVGRRIAGAVTKANTEINEAVGLTLKNAMAQLGKQRQASQTQAADAQAAIMQQQDQVRQTILADEQATKQRMSQARAGLEQWTQTHGKGWLAAAETRLGVTQDALRTQLGSDVDDQVTRRWDGLMTQWAQLVQKMDPVLQIANRQEQLERASQFLQRFERNPSLAEKIPEVLRGLPSESVWDLVDPGGKQLDELKRYHGQFAALDEAKAYRPAERSHRPADDRLARRDSERFKELLSAGSELGSWMACLAGAFDRALESRGGIEGTGPGLPAPAQAEWNQSWFRVRRFMTVYAPAFRLLAKVLYDTGPGLAEPMGFLVAAQLRAWEWNRAPMPLWEAAREMTFAPTGAQVTQGRFDEIATALLYLVEAFPHEQLRGEAEPEKKALFATLERTVQGASLDRHFTPCLTRLAAGFGCRYHPVRYYRDEVTDPTIGKRIGRAMDPVDLTELCGHPVPVRPTRVVRIRRALLSDWDDDIFRSGSVRIPIID